MVQDGLERMLRFLNFLNEKNIHFFIEQYSPEGLTVILTLVGARIEVEFKVDHIEYSVFKGSEDVEGDEKALYDLVKKYEG